MEPRTRTTTPSTPRPLAITVPLPETGDVVVPKGLTNPIMCVDVTLQTGPFSTSARLFTVAARVRATDTKGDFVDVRGTPSHADIARALPGLSPLLELHLESRAIVRDQNLASQAMHRIWATQASGARHDLFSLAQLAEALGTTESEGQSFAAALMRAHPGEANHSARLTALFEHIENRVPTERVDAGRHLIEQLVADHSLALAVPAPTTKVARPQR